MIEREDVVAGLVSAAGGELVGRVRLQKTLYLLERLGLGTGLSFEYHHYGPYSRELDNAISDAEEFNLVGEELGRRQSDGAMFSIFKLKEGARVKKQVYGPLGEKRVSQLVQQFAATPVTVLELAATVDWLWRFEKLADWRGEITKRKGKKVLGGRLEKAIELLEALGLALPVERPRLVQA